MGGFLPLQAGCFHALRPHNCKLKIGNAKFVFITGPHATFFTHTDFALKFLAMKKNSATRNHYLCKQLQACCRKELSHFPNSILHS